MGLSGRRGVVIPAQGRWPARLTTDWSHQRPVLVINEAPEMLSRLASSTLAYGDVIDGAHS